MQRRDEKRWDEKKEEKSSFPGQSFHFNSCKQLKMSGYYRHAATTLKSAFSARSVAIRQKMPRLMKPGQVEHHEHLVSCFRRLWLALLVYLLEIFLWGNAMMWYWYSGGWWWLCWGFLIFCVVTLLPFKPLLIVRFVCMFADVPPPLPRWFDRLRHLRCSHYWSFGCCSLREVCISLRIVALCLSL